MEILDLLAQLVIVAVGALGGSAFMWFVIGPLVITRAAPKVVRKVMKDTFDLSEDEIKEAGGSMFKAMTKKQGASFADAVNGALGNMIGAKPTDELEALAQKYGFAGVEDAKSKILGNGVGGGLGAGISQANPQALLGVMEQLGAGGGNNKFSGLVQTIALIQSLAQLGGGGADGGMPGLPGMGNSGSHSYGW